MSVAVIVEIKSKTGHMVNGITKYVPEKIKFVQFNYAQILRSVFVIFQHPSIHCNYIFLIYNQRINIQFNNIRIFFQHF